MLDLFEFFVDELLDSHGLLVQMGQFACTFEPRLTLALAPLGKLFFDSLRNEFPQWNSQCTGRGLGFSKRSGPGSPG